MATYYHPTEWILVGLANLAWSVPIGAMLDYTGATAPNSQFVLPFGQPISRTTYATYFALVGSIYGSGDGSTTFNVPDLRGRAVFGKDDMGGSAASRITSNTFSSGGGTNLGSAGGGETVTISQANLPNVNLSAASLTVSGSVSASNQVRSYPNSINNVPSGGGSTNAVAQNGQIDATFSFNGSVGGSVPLGGSGTAANNMPPGIILNKILRIL